MARRIKRQALTVVQGNPEAPVPEPRLAPSGPIKVVRLTAPAPHLVTLAAVTDDDTTPIGTLTLPWQCMDMQDPEWLRERAERVRRFSPQLQLLH